jgi:hypothetical protein
VHVAWLNLEAEAGVKGERGGVTRRSDAADQRSPPRPNDGKKAFIRCAADARFAKIGVNGDQANVRLVRVRLRQKADQKANRRSVRRCCHQARIGKVLKERPVELPADGAGRSAPPGVGDGHERGEIDGVTGGLSGEKRRT